ncbi:MAG: cold shock CspA family protein [Flavobacteriales bacterium]|jgi:cold shock CspA family protein
MGKSQETYGKKEREKKRAQKRKEKAVRSAERKEGAQKGASLEDMLVYVDENGQLTDTPPDPTKKVEIELDKIQLGAAERIDEVPTERQGIIDFFNDSKGFGFIKEIGSGEKYFVHVNGLIDEIREGNKVSFDLERGMKGMNAVNVKIVK